MSGLMKVFSIVLFISVPFLLGAGIWLSDSRLWWMGGIALLFSIIASAFSEALKIQDDEPTLF